MTIRTRLIGPVWLMAFSLVSAAGGRSVAAAPVEPAPTPAAPAPATPPTATPATPPPATAPAPDSSLPPGPLTLEQAIATAYRNNGNIAAADSTLSGSRSRVTEARSGTRPNVTGGITYSGRRTNDIGSIFVNT